MKKIAVILAGCGSMDGSEIHESTLLLYAISKAGASYQIFAPSMQQADVINFISGEATGEKRNVLLESARIARGVVKELSELRVEDFDALMLPGGFGAAKNLFTFAFDGLEFSVNPMVEYIIKGFNSAGKPIGAMCIAPMVLAKLLSDKAVNITLGPDSELCSQVEKRFSITVTETGRDEVVIDKKNRVVTTPAYMYGDSTIKSIGEGAIRLVDAVINML